MVNKNSPLPPSLGESEGTKKDRTKCGLKKLVRPTGVEPVSMASEATILSIELWAHERADL